MINFKPLYFLTLVVAVLTSCKQTSSPATSGTYTIDSSIRKELDKKLPDSERAGLVDIKVYKNGRLAEIADSISWEFGQCLTHATVKDGKVNIYLIAGIFICQITLIKDSCTVQYHPKSNKDIYKLNQGDSLATHVAVPCKTYKVTLAKQPAFREDESFEGIVELTSENYYEVVEGKDIRCNVQLTGYFRTNPGIELFMPKSDN